jgi:hypothetical protein
MENESTRSVVIKQLPIGVSLLDAKTKLGWLDLTTQVAIYCGLSPALVYSVKVGDVPYEKQEMAIERWLDVCDKTVRKFLGTFVNGIANDMPYSLLHLMDTVDIESSL